MKEEVRYRTGTSISPSPLQCCFRRMSSRSVSAWPVASGGVAGTDFHADEAMCGRWVWMCWRVIVPYQL